MKPRLLLLVVPFVIAGLLQGCINVYGTKEDQKAYRIDEEPDCIGYAWPITLSALTLASIAASVFILASSSSESDECEGWFSCNSPRDRKEALGIGIVTLSISLAALSVWSFTSASECSMRKNAYKKWLSGLSPDEAEKHKAETEHRRYIERCKELKEKNERMSDRISFRNYRTKCRKFIKNDVSATDIEGRTALHKAVMEGDWRKARLLLSLGSDINAKDKYGWTPLHYAAQVESDDIVEMLLKRGADPKIKDNQGKTPLDIAVEKGHEGVADILRRSEGK